MAQDGCRHRISCGAGSAEARLAIQGKIGECKALLVRPVPVWAVVHTRFLLCAVAVSGEKVCLHQPAWRVARSVSRCPEPHTHYRGVLPFFVMRA